MNTSCRPPGHLSVLPSRALAFTFLGSDTATVDHRLLSSVRAALSDAPEDPLLATPPPVL
jgi:hypothetical protein